MSRGLEGGGGIDGRRQAIKQTQKGDHSQAEGNEGISSKGDQQMKLPTPMFLWQALPCHPRRALLATLWGPTRGSLPQSIDPCGGMVSLLQTWHPSLIW